MLVEALGLFQAADKQQGIFILLFCSVHLGRLSEESLLTLPWSGKGEQVFLKSRAFLLKSRYWFYYCWSFSSSPWMGQLWGLHWRTLPCFPNGPLFPVFLFRSSVWLVTHIWVSENGKSFRSLSYIQWCPIFLSILWSDLYFDGFSWKINITL